LCAVSGAAARRRWSATVCIAAKCSLPCAGSFEREPSGGCCHRNCRPGRWSTSRPSAGSPRAASKPWSTISALSCACPLRCAAAHGSGAGSSHAAVHAPKRPPGLATTGTEEAWLQDPRGGGHTREPAGAGGHPRFGAGAIPSRGTRPHGAGGDRRACRTGLCGPGLHWQRCAEAAQTHGIRLQVVKHSEAKRGFVLLPRRWVVERSFAWAARFRRLARAYERLPQTLAALHFMAFACLLLSRLPLLLLGPSSPVAHSEKTTTYWMCRRRRRITSSKGQHQRSHGGENGYTWIALGGPCRPALAYAPARSRTIISTPGVMTKAIWPLRQWCDRRSRRLVGALPLLISNAATARC
jgi:hypothetical protein